jgi:hypothetical protein
MSRLRIVTAIAALGLASLTGAMPTAAAVPSPAHYTGALPDGASWIADVPASWNGTIILYSHGYGPFVAQDAPNPATRQALLDDGYALVGSSYSGPSWLVLAGAVDDQFGALAALEQRIAAPRQVIAWGTSMGGLVSALEAEQGAGRIDAALTTCGIVAGELNLSDYQLDGEWALSHLLAPDQQIKLADYSSSDEAIAAAQTLTAVVAQAQSTAQGRARTALGAALMHLPAWAPSETQPAPTDYPAQENQQAEELSTGLTSLANGRYQMQQYAGGNPSSTVGVDYAALLRHSSQREQIAALYRAAGLDLGTDLKALTRHADIRGDRTARATFGRETTPTGRLTVPELDIHTIADQKVPVDHESWYAAQVRRAGRTSLLRQAYVEASGHCNFQPAATIAALRAVERRLDTGRWDDVTSPARLNAAATATGLGSFGPYIPFTPPQLYTGRTITAGQR